MVCPGVVAVSPKQRKHITLYSRLTTTPEPDVEAMVSSVEAMLMLRLATVVLLRGLDVDRQDYNGAERWLAGRWHDWLDQGGPLM